jgi:hypothetical protein
MSLIRVGRRRINPDFIIEVLEGGEADADQDAPAMPADAVRVTIAPGQCFTLRGRFGIELLARLDEMTELPQPTAPCQPPPADSTAGDSAAPAVAVRPARRRPRTPAPDPAPTDG